MRQIYTIEAGHRYTLSAVAGDSTRLGYYLCEVRATGTRRLVYLSHEGGRKTEWMRAIGIINTATRTGLDQGEPSYVGIGGDSLAVRVDSSRA